jgi:aspartyl-tRNA(Asn)/glutamyl-tRNA(Gln) amidotransferase subunit A
MSDLHRLLVSDLSALIDRREVSPVDVTTALLERIAAVNPSVNAVATLQPETAMQEAKAAEAEIAKGRRRGPLHGIPIAHKDLYWTKGLRTTAGSRLKENFAPEEDATLVERYRQAGTILLGKLNTQEFAYGPTNEHSLFGAALNPCTPAAQAAARLQPWPWTCSLRRPVRTRAAPFASLPLAAVFPASSRPMAA